MVIIWAAWLADLRVRGHARRDWPALSTPAGQCAGFSTHSVTSLVVMVITATDSATSLGTELQALLLYRSPIARAATDGHT